MRTDRVVHLPAPVHHHREVEQSRSAPLRSPFALSAIARVKATEWAPIGACIYIASVGLQFAWDVSLVVLVICAAGVLRARRSRVAREPLRYAVLAFLTVTAIAILGSPQRDEIVALSLSLLPGTLLFLVIANGFQNTQHTRALYLAFSCVSFVLCGWLIWNAWLDGPVSPNTWVLHAGTPLLVVGNDVTFFAVLAPLALAGLWSTHSIAQRAISVIALVFTVIVVVLFDSRGAVLTLVASLGCCAALIRPRIVLAGIALLAGAILTADATLGWPVIEKFAGTLANGDAADRITLWRSAWAAFLEAPWIGHGPHSVRYLASHGSESVRWAHNLYLDVLVGQGVLGFAAFLTIAGGAIVLARETHTQARDGEVRLLNAGALSALVGLLLAAIWEISFLRLWVVVTFFALIGVIAHLWTVTRAGGAGEAGRSERADTTGLAGTSTTTRAVRRVRRVRATGTRDR